MRRWSEVCLPETAKRWRMRGKYRSAGKGEAEQHGAVCAEGMDGRLLQMRRARATTPGRERRRQQLGPPPPPPPPHTHTPPPHTHTQRLRRLTFLAVVVHGEHVAELIPAATHRGRLGRLQRAPRLQPRHEGLQERSKILHIESQSVVGQHPACGLAGRGRRAAVGGCG